MPNILGVPNPISAIEAGAGNVVGAAAAATGNAAAGAVSSGLNGAMGDIWNFATSLLSGAFAWIDELGAPNVDPRSGPLAGVLPTVLWLGAFVVVVLAFVQIGRAALDGGKGFATLLVGIAQYAVISTGALGFLAVLISASDALAVGLLKGGLGVNNWAGINAQNSVLGNAVHTVGGVGLGLIALFVLIPAAFFLVVETLVRHASILVLAATIPLLAAGLVQESTTRWFWTGLRWMFALLMMSPAIALVMVIGLRLAAAATGANGASQTAPMALVQLVVSSAVMLISLLCPLALFKLFAFMDPTTISGARMRGSLAGGGGGSTSSSSAAQDAGQGADADTAGRFASAMSGAGTLARSGATNAASTAAGMLDTVGAGHGGSPQDDSSSRSRSKTRSQDDDTAQDEAGAPADVEPAPPAGGGGSAAPPSAPSPSASPAGGAGPAGTAGGSGGAASGGAAASGGSAAGAAGALEGAEAAAVVVAL